MEYTIAAPDNFLANAQTRVIPKESKLTPQVQAIRKQASVAAYFEYTYVTLRHHSHTTCCYEVRLQNFQVFSVGPYVLTCINDTSRNFDISGSTTMDSTLTVASDAPQIRNRFRPRLQLGSPEEALNVVIAAWKTATAHAHPIYLLDDSPRTVAAFHALSNEILLTPVGQELHDAITRDLPAKPDSSHMEQQISRLMTGTRAVWDSSFCLQGEAQSYKTYRNVHTIADENFEAPLMLSRDTQLHAILTQMHTAPTFEDEPDDLVEHFQEVANSVGSDVYTLGHILPQVLR